MWCAALATRCHITSARDDRAATGCAFRGGNVEWSRASTDLTAVSAIVSASHAPKCVALCTPDGVRTRADVHRICPDRRCCVVRRFAAPYGLRHAPAMCARKASLLRDVDSHDSVGIANIVVRSATLSPCTTRDAHLGRSWGDVPKGFAKVSGGRKTRKTTVYSFKLGGRGGTPVMRRPSETLTSAHLQPAPERAHIAAFVTARKSS